MDIRELELADIAGYLPYGLKLYSERMAELKQSEPESIKYLYNPIVKITSLFVEKDKVVVSDGRGVYSKQLHNLKPLLNPMSDLTKPMTHPDINNGEEFVPIAYISFEILGNYTPNKWEVKKGSDTIDGEIVRQTIGVEYSDNLGGGQYAVCFSKGNTSVHIRNANGDMVDTRCTMMVIEFLQKTHFDYLGLIDQGLAIDINTIE